MSTSKLSLKSPATIAVVMVLLVGVVALNLQTFGGRSGARISPHGYRVQAHPPVPSDISSLVNREVSVAVTQGETVVALEWQSVDRDPFHPGQKQKKPKVKFRNTAKKTLSSRKRRLKKLECSAIMLGGNKPMAIIGSESHFLGDKIRGMTLNGIDADGVTFKKSDGSNFYLVVGVQEENNMSFRVVTQSKIAGDQDRTRLVDK